MKRVASDSKEELLDELGCEPKRPRVGEVPEVGDAIEAAWKQA